MEEVILEQDPKRNRLIDIIEIIVICNNYASKENLLTIYQLLDKEPYLRKIYQTPKNNKDRVSWEVYDWRGNCIILKSKFEEGKSGEKIIYFQIDSKK